MIRFAKYLTCKMGYWRKEAHIYSNDYFARAKILTTFLIEAWCLTRRWTSKHTGICWKLGRSLLIKALCNLARQIDRDIFCLKSNNIVKIFIWTKCLANFPPNILFGLGDLDGFWCITDNTLFNPCSNCCPS